MEELLEILEEIKPDIDFENETGLIADSLLSSLDIIQIVAELSEEFDVEIGAGDIVPDNFNSAEAMWNMIQKLMD